MAGSITVFVNTKQRTIQVSDSKSVTIYPFEDVDVFLEDCQGKQCLYITNAVKTTVEEIVSLVGQFSGEDEELNIADSKTNFIHSTKKGTLVVPDSDIIFRGVGDCRVFDQDIYNLIEESFPIRQLLKQGILELITYSQMKKIVRDAKRANKKILDKQKLSKEQRDRALDALLVDTGVKAEDAVGNMFKGKGDDNSVKVLDITDEVKTSEKDLSTEEIHSGHEAI